MCCKAWFKKSCIVAVLTRCSPFGASLWLVVLLPPSTGGACEAASESRCWCHQQRGAGLQESGQGPVTLHSRGNAGADAGGAADIYITDCMKGREPVDWMRIIGPANTSMGHVKNRLTTDPCMRAAGRMQPRQSAVCMFGDEHGAGGEVFHS